MKQKQNKENKIKNKKFLLTKLTFNLLVVSSIRDKTGFF